MFNQRPVHNELFPKMHKEMNKNNRIQYTYVPRFQATIVHPQSHSTPSMFDVVETREEKITVLAANRRNIVVTLLESIIASVARVTGIIERRLVAMSTITLDSFASSQAFFPTRTLREALILSSNPRPEAPRHAMSKQ